MLPCSSSLIARSRLWYESGTSATTVYVSWAWDAPLALALSASSRVGFIAEDTYQAWLLGRHRDRLVLSRGGTHCRLGDRGEKPAQRCAHTTRRYLFPFDIARLRTRVYALLPPATRDFLYSPTHAGMTQLWDTNLLFWSALGVRLIIGLSISPPWLCAGRTDHLSLHFARLVGQETDFASGTLSKYPSLSQDSGTSVQLTLAAKKRSTPHSVDHSQHSHAFPLTYDYRPAGRPYSTEVCRPAHECGRTCHH